MEVNCGTTLSGLQRGMWFNQTLYDEGQEFCIYRCLERSACLVDVENSKMQCADGYKGPLCGVCEDGWARAGTSCVECYSTAVSWVLLVVVFLLLATALMVGVVRVMKFQPPQVLNPGEAGREALTTLKILLNFMQMTSFLSAFAIDYPSLMRSLFDVAVSSGGISFQATFINCALQWNARHEFLAFFLIPVLVVLLPASIIGLRVYHFNRTEKKRLKKDPDAEPKPPLLFWGVTPRSLYFMTTMLLLFMVYPPLVRRGLSQLPCIEVDGQHYLQSDMRLSCDADAHNVYRVFAFIHLALFSFGFPITSFAVLFRNRQRLHTPKARRRLLFLFSGYTRKAYFWESVVMLRKLSIIAVTILIDNANGHQLYAGLWVFLLSLLLHIYFEPFRDATQGRLESASLLLCLMGLLFAQLFYLDEIPEGAKIFAQVAILVGFVLYVLAALCVLLFDLILAARRKNLYLKLKKYLPCCFRCRCCERLFLDEEVPSLAAARARFAAAGKHLSVSVKSFRSLVAAPKRWSRRRKMTRRVNVAEAERLRAALRGEVLFPEAEDLSAWDRSGDGDANDLWSDEEGDGEVAEEEEEKGAGGGAWDAEAWEGGEGGGWEEEGGDHESDTWSMSDSRARACSTASGRLRALSDVSQPQSSPTNAEGHDNAAPEEQKKPAAAGWSMWASKMFRKGTSKKQTKAAKPQAMTRNPSNSIRSAGLFEFQEVLNQRQGGRVTLAGGWEERLHPQNNMWYYYNTGKRTLTWERPRELRDIATGHWKMQTDPDTAKAVFFNPVSGEVMMSRPEEFVLSESQCWERRIHPITGLPYYKNSMTGKEQWEVPAALVLSNGGSGGGSQGATATGPRKRKKKTKKPKSPRREEATIDIEMHSNPVNDWELCVDDNTGYEYWYNRTTGESQWVEE